MSEGRVLVVGAGPVGLTMACELLRHGAKVRLIDAADEPSDKSKAIIVHARSLEMLDNMGCVNAFLREGSKFHAVNIHAGGKLLARVSFDDADWADATYVHSLLIPQSATERLLSHHFGVYGGTVERNHKLVEIEQNAGTGNGSGSAGNGSGSGSVSVTIVEPDGKAVQSDYDWVVACDGAHSTVRKALDVPFEGERIAENFYLADVKMDIDLAEGEGATYICDDGALMIVPMASDRYRVMCAPREGAALLGDDEEPTLGFFQGLFDKWTSVSAKLSDDVWLSSFRISRRLVPDYRHGCVFLAGDAAHIHSPAGGQGMNLGMQDAYNLGWKLALVARGQADALLLDSYSAERRPVAQSTLKGTSRATKMITLRNPIARSLRNHLAEHLINLEIVQERMQRSMSMLSLSYRDSPIVEQYRQSLAHANVRTSDTTENPSIRHWREFGKGPAAGDRAPDVTYDDNESRLFKLLRGTKHTMLLFDGAAATAEGYESLMAIAKQVAQQYGEHVKTHIIVPSKTRPKELEDAESVILDVDGDLHEAYGAGAECLYLVRPDGYIGFRCQPADVDHVTDHLFVVLGK